MGKTASLTGRRGRALLERLMRQEIRLRLGPLLDLRGRYRHLDGAIDREEKRLRLLENDLEGPEQLFPKAPFSAEMTMDHAWKHHSDAPMIFARHHLPGCDSCAVRFDETLHEAATAYGLDLDRLLEELNSLLTGP